MYVSLKCTRDFAFADTDFQSHGHFQQRRYFFPCEMVSYIYVQVGPSYTTVYMSGSNNVAISRVQTLQWISSSRGGEWQYPPTTTHLQPLGALGANHSGGRLRSGRPETTFKFDTQVLYSNEHGINIVD